MAARRKRLNVFGLSFLDCMCCGFGAVILFFMIINTGNDELAHALVAESERLDEEVLEGRKQLVVLRNAVEEIEQEEVEVQGRSDRILAEIEKMVRELAELDHQTLARNEHIKALQADLQSLDEETRRLEGGSHGDESQGEALRTVAGEGDRQYLTGLKVGGRRILLLVDSSASMLDRTVVNVIRRRNLPEAQKLRAEKWQQVGATVDWLTAQIPANSQFQIYRFGNTAEPVLAGTEGQWLDAGAPRLLDDAVLALRRTVPDGGTSLHLAFEAIADLAPPPDNVYLLTDGLPTRGRGEPWFATASADRRLALFVGALKELPSGVPVNVILYPMEGDPMASHSYWRLAQQTGGSFMSPSADWP